MKTCIKNLFLLPALIAGLGLIPAGRVTAQTFTNLHSFTGGSDGANPYAGLILSGNTLYGTALSGGSSGHGTVFAVNINGTGFTNLYTFTAVPGSLYTNSDGASPAAGLILSGNTLYGTANTGGSSSRGTVFAVSTDGTGFTTLHNFTGGSDGAFPQAGLILSGNTLYGTAYGGGSSGKGTVFAVSTDGTGFTNLHSFNYSDGVNPTAGLILSGNALYGTASSGGSWNGGTLFAVHTNGTGFTNLYSFSVGGGGLPYAGVILSGNTLYGTAQYYGSLGDGTVFAVNTNGTGFTNLHSFTALSVPYTGTNSDGAWPQAGLILSGNTLYGTAFYGGSSGYGTVFAVHTDGTGFTNLHSFTRGSDGANPQAGLIVSGNTLYGTTTGGGSSGQGTVFSLSLGSVSAPQLTIIRSGANVILTWPTNATGFTLQSTTNLVSTTVWSNVSPAAVVVNTNNAVTNAISDKQKFYRLSQ